MKPSRRLLAGSTIALLAPLLLAVPAQADDPTAPAAPAPAVSCEDQLAAWKLEAAYWRGDAEAAVSSELRAADRALAAEGRAEALAQQLGARTAERDRLRTQNNALRTQRNRLQAKVAELRERLTVARS